MVIRIWAVLILLICLLCQTGCKGCEEEDDEVAIRKIVDRAIELAESHEVKSLMALTSEDFRADPGSKDQRDTRMLLMFAFKRYKKFTIKHPDYGVDISDIKTEASVRMPFLLVREGKSVPDLKELADDPGKWIEQASEVADPYYLNLSFRKEGGEWLVDGARLDGVRTLGGIY